MRGWPGPSHPVPGAFPVSPGGGSGGHHRCLRNFISFKTKTNVGLQENTSSSAFLSFVARLSTRQCETVYPVGDLHRYTGDPGWLTNMMTHILEPIQTDPQPLNI